MTWLLPETWLDSRVLAIFERVAGLMVVALGATPGDPAEDMGPRQETAE